MNRLCAYPFIHCSLFLMSAVLGTAHAAHPLQTDDTGTQDQDHWQLEFNADRTVTRETDGVGHDVAKEVNATLTYGVTPTLDVFFNLPWSWLDQRNPENGGRDRVSGQGELALGLKWRAWARGSEGDRWSLGVKTELLLPTSADERGIGAGRTNLAVTGLLNYEWQDWTFLGNLSLATNRVPNAPDQQRATVAGISSAALFKVAAAWRLALDMGVTQGAETNAANVRYVLLGVIYSPKDTLDFDMGLRHNRQSTVRQNTFGLGVTVRY